MRERNIALIGFRATGKSTVGRILAEKLGRIFIDMDQHLIASAGREISCWVKLEGWDSFRKAESELLRTLISREGLVVATGGGIILDPQNRRILNEHFFTTWLKASVETIFCRTNSDPGSCAARPPLSELPLRDEIKKVLSERRPLYAAAANLEIDTEKKTAEEIAEQIARSAPFIKNS
jgi:shikimate kinase